MRFVDSEFRMFREDLRKALAPIEEKYGIELEQGNINYNDEEFRMKLTGKKYDPNAKEKTQEELFAENCKYYGFKPEDYRRSFTIDGKVYKLIGFKPKARKNVCFIENSNGKVYVTDLYTVVNGFKSSTVQ